MERITDPNTQLVSMSHLLVRRCCNPLCCTIATWVSHGGRFIWCEKHSDQQVTDF